MGRSRQAGPGLFKSAQARPYPIATSSLKTKKSGFKYELGAQKRSLGPTQGEEDGQMEKQVHWDQRTFGIPPTRQATGPGNSFRPK
uniref:Uncharacterized protein n=1 Tax=Bursaphelenchus xylophilus TaxID=6326 RepID=A0A1I7SIY8_BURXY